MRLRRAAVRERSAEKLTCGEGVVLCVAEDGMRGGDLARTANGHLLLKWH